MQMEAAGLDFQESVFTRQINVCQFTRKTVRLSLKPRTDVAERNTQRISSAFSPR